MIPSRLSGQGLILPAGSNMILNSGTLILYNNLTNNGLITDNEGTTIFAGSGQSINGTSPVTFNNLIINNGSTTSLITSGEAVKGELRCEGTLNAGGKLILLSTADQTALIDGTGEGTVSGNITMQRYLPSGYGYKFFSSPFQAAGIGEFADDLDLTQSFAPLYRYDENQAFSWWIIDTTVTDTLTPMSGFAVNFGASASAKTVDISGVVNNGDLSVSLFNHNQPFTQGFNLVGNPYPSPIDWNASSGWTRTNIDDAIYYFNNGSANQYVGTYSSYINGISSDGVAGKIIPAMQGFFVHVSNGTYPVSALLGFSNAVRVNSHNPVFHKTGQQENPSIVRLTAGFSDNNNLVDYFVIHLDDSATSGTDKKFDAIKIMNTDQLVPNLYGISSEGIHLSIDALPYTGDSTVVPLGINANAEGLITIRLLLADRLPTGTYIYLYDYETDMIKDIHKDPVYTLFLDKGETINRLFIIFSQKEMKEQPGNPEKLSVHFSGNLLHIQYRLAYNEKGIILISNIMGQIVRKRIVTGSSSIDEELNWRTGTYVISLMAAEGTFSKKVVITDQ
ncbi:MAG: T9SS type A sorting domain-containing protein [Bacteroidetes bacterium]|nr:T9SS type A sorting domain-containing protein [Bacteroidota bacterium]